VVKIRHKIASQVLKNSYLFEEIYQKRIFLSCSSHQMRDEIAAAQANFPQDIKLSPVNFHSC
jgi:hypothetical protein